jgi:hypothetical protein
LSFRDSPGVKLEAIDDILNEGYFGKDSLDEAVFGDVDFNEFWLSLFAFTDLPDCLKFLFKRSDFKRELILGDDDFLL